MPCYRCLVALVLAVFGASSSSAAPAGGKSRLPYWHAPCGSNTDSQPVDPRNAEEEVRASMTSLRIQHELMMNDYLGRDYEFLYERVRIGVHEHQYIPNWLPGKKDVHHVRKLKHFKPQLVRISWFCLGALEGSVAD